MTLCTGTFGLLKDIGLIPPTIYSLSLGVMIASWVVSALVWCTGAIIEEQRRREARTVNRVSRLLTEHNVAGWTAYAEQAENVHPIKRRR